MKNKKYVVGVASLALLLLVNSVVFEVVMAWRINLVEVVVANRDIDPRSEITKQDFKVIKMPKALVGDTVLDSADEVLGMFTDIEGKIPQGSMFYQSMLYDRKTLPDYPSLLLKTGQVGFAVATDIIKSLGNSLVVGQKVDIYVTITTPTRNVIADCLVQQVRIIGIKDRNGLDLQHEKSNGVPFVVVLAVDENVIDYLKVANKIGMIDLLPTPINHDGLESIMLPQATVMKYLK